MSDQHSAALTAAEKDDVRRFYGYPILPDDLLAHEHRLIGDGLDDRSVPEVGKIREYLKVLRQSIAVRSGRREAFQNDQIRAEEALRHSRGVESAWIKHHAWVKAELKDDVSRVSHINLWRLRLCEFVGIPPGPGIAEPAAPPNAGPSANAPRPLSEWHKYIGPVLWWRFPINEPPYVGTPLDQPSPWVIEAFGVRHEFNKVGGWPGYHTHWTPIPIPEAPQ